MVILVDSPKDALARLDKFDRDQGQQGFAEWLEQHIDDGAGPHWHQDDLEAAFLAGYAWSSQFRWE